MDDNEQEDDVITLRYTLLQCRKQLLSSIKTLFDTEIAYSKVELREDFDRLKLVYDNQKHESDVLRNDFHQLIENCELLIHHTTEILSERDSYYSEWQSAKDILTPRPDWDKCTDLIPDWRNLATGKSSAALVELIIAEITRENPSMSESEFNQTILPKNRHLRRRITGLLIKEIWSNKVAFEVNFTDYVFEYFTRRFDSRDRAMEMSDNVRDACHRYRNHYEINLFWQILTGQMEENVYHYQIKQFARILQYLIKLASNSPRESAGDWKVSCSELLNALRELYPHWSEERASRVIMAAERELHQTSMGENELEFLLLFMEDDEGHVGEFLRSIREELQVDQYEYLEKVKNILIGKPLISIKQFKQAVRLIDPWIPKSELRRYINWIFQPNEAREIPTRDLEEIIDRFERCSCFMHFKE